MNRLWVTGVLLSVDTFATIGAFAGTDPVNFNLTADDYGTLTIDGTLLGTYDNISAAGNIFATANLTPGWHTISMDYANRLGVSQQGHPRGPNC